MPTRDDRRRDRRPRDDRPLPPRSSGGGLVIAILSGVALSGCLLCGGIGLFFMSRPTERNRPSEGPRKPEERGAEAKLKQEEKGTEAAPEWEPLIGEWLCSSETIGGEPLKPRYHKKWSFNGDNVRINDNRPLWFRLDKSTTPNQLFVFTKNADRNINLYACITSSRATS